MKPPFQAVSLILFSVSLVVTCLLFFQLFFVPPVVKNHNEYGWCGTVDYEERRKRIVQLDSSEVELYKEGEQLFKNAGCPSCHNIDTKKVGPPLRNILSRRSKIWVKQAILNYEVLIQIRDKEAIALREEYGGMIKPLHTFLSNEELEKIIFYIDK